MLETSPARVLLVAPAGAETGEYARLLDRPGLSIDTCSDPDEVLDRVAGVDAVVSTYRLGDTDGVAVLRDVRESCPDLPFVVLAEDGTEAIASEAIRAGATDYVPVPEADVASRVREAVHSSGTGGDAGREDVHERISDPFYAVDREFRFTYVNERAEELFGASEADLLGRGLFEAYPEAAGTEAQEACREALETGETTGFERYCETFDRWVAARVYPSETGLSISVRDASDRKERERELDFRTALLEAQAESTIDGFLVVDDDRDIVYHNGQFADIWDIPESVLADGSDENALEYVYDKLEHPEEFLEKVEYLYENPLEESRDEIELADGRWIDRYSAPVMGDDGTQYGRLWVFRDITRRKTRERALREAYEVIANPDLSFPERVDALLETGRAVLGTDYATFARVRDGAYALEATAAPDHADVEVGDALPLLPPADPECDRPKRTLVAENVEGASADAVAPGGAASCYLGAPVTVDEETYGVFCFYDTEARVEEFSDWQVTFVDLLGSWLSSELERKRTTARLVALDELNGIVRDINHELAQRTTREEIERVVCERLAESDSYEFAWIGTLEEETGEIEPSAVANARGDLDGLTITADDSEAGRGPMGRALRTGEPQVVQNVEEVPGYDTWRERGIAASAAIPIAHEDRSYGVLNVYTGRTNAFDAEERAVVEQLGEITGLALAAIERERELRESERRYRTLAENIPDGAVALFDSDRRNRIVAGTAFEDLPIDPEDVRGRRVTDVDGLAADVRRELDQVYGSALAGEPDRIRCRLGDRVFEVKVIPVRNESGEVTGGMALARDVTERVERERRIEAIFDQTYQFTGLMEPDGTLIEANRTALDFGGLDREDVIGEKMWETYWFQASEETRERAREAVGRAREGEFVRHELPVQGGDREAIIDFSIRPVTDDQGEVTLLIPEGRDITERVERERQLAHERERLEFVNRLIRHNLLNSLNVVQARTSLVENYVDPEAREHLGTIRERTADMIDLIETLRSMMRVVVEDERELETVDVGDVLSAEIDDARRAFEDAVFEARVDDPGLVRADDLLGEVFENLLVNAVQHNDADLPRVVVEAESGEEAVTVRIADNGPGVPREIEETVFEKGEKGFESPGTGFGLHLAREIVDAYGGTIEVSNDDSGAVFSITLPRV